ncbi:MAG: M28 family peptidase [Chlorobiota bacterium]|nr:MAG: M28 family peptidase [Chlorobiota bacterium]
MCWFFCGHPMPQFSFQRSALFTAIALAVVCTAAGQSHSLADRLRQHVQVLASPKLEGREPATPGNELAARYIAEQFQSIGIAPLGSDYFQRFSIPSRIELEGTNSVRIRMLLERPGIPREALKPVAIQWNPQQEYVPLGISDTGSITAPVVFCGFGQQRDGGLDEFAGMDVSGKIALILTGDPDHYNPHEPFRVNYSELRRKALRARRAGARAVVFIHPQGDSSEVLMPLRYDGRPPIGGILAIHAKRSIAARLFPRAQSLFTREQEIVKTKQPRSFQLPDVEMTLSVSYRLDSTTIPNVIGIVRGTEPAKADEYIVVGAHFDHLGWGDDNSLYTGADRKIHPGADDNASGTAGLIELARALATKPPARSVVFCAFNAEERGLFGSTAYVQSPLVPLEKTVAMLNLDMIGRMQGKRINIQGVGSSSLWKPLMDSLATAAGFEPSYTDDGIGPSDHTSFYLRGIPVLFFFTGLHSDYHRPTDTWEKLNYTGQARVVELVQRVIESIAALPERPAFTKVASSQRHMGTGPAKVRLGVMPDYADHPKGLRVSGIIENSPAARAGLRDGDIIVQIGTTAIRSIYDLMDVLSRAKPGEEAEIIVLRGPNEDQRVVLHAIFEASR